MKTRQLPACDAARFCILRSGKGLNCNRAIPSIYIVHCARGCSSRPRSYIFRSFPQKIKAASSNIRITLP